MGRGINKLKLKLSEVLPFLNEKQRRVLAAAEARAIGRGGIQIISQMTGISRPTIYRGLGDLDNDKEYDRIRDPGGGRKKLVATNPKLIKELEKLIDPVIRGDPESPLRWTCKSVRKLSKELQKAGYRASYKTVANILHELDYRLQGNRKATEGKKDHPDRNEQFLYINNQAKKYLKAKIPVISVDTKKKELVGKYKNNGREWRKTKQPEKVLSHDFPDPKNPKAVPYGIYDIAKNMGWVSVGISADTSEFAVESIRQWWKHMGKRRYPAAKKLYICADSGGSNGYRCRLWKMELQKLSNQLDFHIIVSHFPPGTSKWNKIEHRLFSFISMNWRGRPLVDYQTIVNLIAATTTKTGLKVKARLDKKTYHRGIKVTDFEFKKLNIQKHDFHGEWNYTVKPT
jgi:hypothetical protein